MPVTVDHYEHVRNHFRSLLGDECQVCGSVFNLEFHHKLALKTKQGRGRDVRMWEWFTAWADKNLSLLCHDCHTKFHNGKTEE